MNSPAQKTDIVNSSIAARRVLVLLLLLGLSVSGWAIYQRLEPYKNTVDLGYQEVARRNQWLAAQQLLQQRQHSVVMAKSAADLSKLPANAILIITEANIIKLDKQRDALLDWVRAGGHLIIGVPTYQYGDNLLLDILGLAYERFEKESDKASDGTESADAEKKQSAPGLQSNRDEIAGRESDEAQSSDFVTDNMDSNEESGWAHDMREHNRRLEAQKFEKEGKPIPQELRSALAKKAGSCPTQQNFFTVATLPGFPANIAANFSSDLHLVARFDGLTNDKLVLRGKLGTEDVDFLLQFNIGHGRLTAFNNFLWTNHNIGDADHAFLLAYLVQGDAPVWWLESAAMPHLMVLLWRYAPELLLLTALLIVLWCWQRSLAFGPLRELDVIVRRAISEKWQASGEYRWRRQCHEALLAGVRRDIHVRASNTLSGYPIEDVFTAKNQHLVVQLLARHSQLSPAEIDHALFENHFVTEAEFTRTVMLLQQLRSLL